MKIVCLLKVVIVLLMINWPGENILTKNFAPNGAVWSGLYPSEINSVTMLGDEKELKWEITREGMRIETPLTKPCDYAYVFKIVRRPPF
jgi:alpha-L-fucosidase